MEMQMDADGCKWMRIDANAGLLEWMKLKFFLKVFLLRFSLLSSKLIALNVLFQATLTT